MTDDRIPDSKSISSLPHERVLGSQRVGNSCRMTSRAARSGLYEHNEPSMFQGNKLLAPAGGWRDTEVQRLGAPIKVWIGTVVAKSGGLVELVQL
jgi:hypothetical protein